LTPFGIIIAAVAAIATIVAVVIAVVAVVLVAPTTITALAAFVIALAVVTTTVLTVDVGLIFDCCVPSPPEEDHRPPPSMPLTSCKVRQIRGTACRQVRESLFSTSSLCRT
jgi:hypothetical protein